MGTFNEFERDAKRLGCTFNKSPQGGSQICYGKGNCTTYHPHVSQQMSPHTQDAIMDQIGLGSNWKEFRRGSLTKKQQKKIKNDKKS